MPHETSIQRALRDAQEGRIQEGIASLRKLLRIQPGNVEAMHMLGLLLTQAGQNEQALQCMARTVALQPAVPGVRNNYGSALLAARRHAEAAAQFRRATELDPAYARAWLGLASALSESGDTTGALEACARGLALKPEWPELERVHATALEASDMLEQAIAVLERACARSPQDAALRSRLLMAVNYTSIPAPRIAQMHREYAQTVTRAPEPAARPADPERPLRIGVLSGDLRSHSVGFFAWPILAARPAGSTLTVFATTAAPAGDRMAEGYRALADEWVDAALMGADELDRSIRSRQIDVLLELSGHSGAARLSALDTGPAPVIITAIGYPNTTGHPMVGWRLVDSVTDPPGSEHLASERLVRMDPCFLCYRAPEEAPTPALPPESAPLTFGSFNATSKLREKTLALWSRVLAQVPASRLLLKASGLADPASRERLLQRIAAHGIPRERVDCLPFARGVGEHLALYNRVHVALDSTPYNGTTTTCEALWMGVPVVALAGDRHAARVGASLLHTVGMPELVAPDEDSYVSQASALIADRQRLQRLRADLRPMMRGSPLMDSDGYGARLHAAIRACWREWCAR